MSGAVAVVGLGHMGSGIARNLDNAGRLVAACDVVDGVFAAADLSDRVRDLSGQPLVDAAESILLVVPSTSEVEAALAGCRGRGRQLVVDLTTSDPVRSRALAVDLEVRGFRYIDAAMTGGAAGADAGSLTLMVGGAADDLGRARPILDIIADRIFHLGPVGAGHAMKLVHNMILHSSFMATCEGLRLAERAGLDIGMAVEVLNAGNARSFVTEVRFPRDILSGAMNARSVVNNLEKDLGLANGFAAGMGAPVPYAALTHRVLSEAVARGAGAADFSYLFPQFEELVDGLGQADRV